MTGNSTGRLKFQNLKFSMTYNSIQAIKWPKIRK